MSTPIKEVVFRDLPLSFTPHPITKKIVPLENDNAVKNALKNLILTNLYEVPYEPLFGSDVTNQLFENFTSMTSHTLKKNIKTAIANFEPRVELIGIDIDENHDHSQLNVSIFFRVINQTEPVQLDLIIERVR